MPPTVFPFNTRYTLIHSIKFQTFVAEMGDGFEQRVNKNLTWSRANGLGGVTSYKGINSFTINLRGLPHCNESVTHEANILWSFYQSCLGNLVAFYFYNPAENETIDLSGANTTGRYLVRFAQNNLSRENFMRKLFNVSGLALVEVRV